MLLSMLAPAELRLCPGALQGRAASFSPLVTVDCSSVDLRNASSTVTFSPKTSLIPSSAYLHKSGYLPRSPSASHDCGTSGINASDRYPSARQSRLEALSSLNIHLFCPLSCCRGVNAASTSASNLNLALDCFSFTNPVTVGRDVRNDCGMRSAAFLLLLRSSSRVSRSSDERPRCSVRALPRVRR